jgi:hypothetical protein
MTLGELIEFLEKRDPEKVVPLGFNYPHSYRGYYDQLAFEPAPKIKVSEMLVCTRESLGETYIGYKGGEFKMDKWTKVWLAYYGETGEEIGPVLLKYMVGEI